MKSRKAVSPVIAVILLIAIAVAASVTVFAYTQGILGGVTQANLVISNFQDLDSNTVTVTIQNVGGTSTTVDQIDQEDDGSNIDGTQEVRNAITGELIDADGDSGFNTDLVISAGNSVTVEIDRDSGSWATNEVCTVELWVEGNTGSTASFEADFVV